MRGPIARATLRTGVVLGVRLVVLMCTLLVVARVLGPADFGAFAGVAALAVTLGTLSTFGTHILLLAEVSQAPERRHQVLPFALPATLLCGGGLLGLYVLTCLALLPAAPGPAVLLALGATELLLNPLLSLCSAEQQARGHIALSQALPTLPLVLRLGAAGAIWFLHAEEPLLLYTIACALASAAALLLGWSQLPAPWPAFREWRLPRAEERRAAAGYAALSVSGVATLELDKTLALNLLAAPATGLYATGTRVIGALTLPVLAMIHSASPRLFRERASPSAQSARLLLALYGSALAYGVLISGILWFAAPLVEALFGPGYAGLAAAVSWLCAVIPGVTLRLTAANILLALGRPYLRGMIEGAGVAVLAALALALAPRHGVAGMAGALAGAEMFMALALTASILVTRPRARPSGRESG
jgi:O-antigen/teichoic acid export membrane protein